MEHIKSLTPLRGLAALAVTLMHIQLMLKVSNLPWPDLTASTKFISQGYLFVDFFFFLSGFIITHVYAKSFIDGVSKDSYMRFLQHRFARVYPVHFLFIIAFVPLELAKWYVVYRHPDAAAATPPFAGDFELSALPSEVFLFNAMGLEDGSKWNQPSWSIGAEWYTYMLFPFFIGFFHRMRLRPLLYISACMLAVVLYISMLDPERQLNRHYDYGFLRCLAEFCVGVVIYRLYTMRIAALVDVFSRDVTFIVIATYIVVVMHLGMHPMLIVPAMALLVLAAAANTGLSQRCLNVRPLVYLGDISYSVYMSHWFVITLVGRVVKVVISPEFMASLTSVQVAGLMTGVIVAVLAVTIAISSLVYKYFEVPARYWVRSLRWPSREGKTA